MLHHGAGAYICGEKTASWKPRRQAAAETSVPANMGLYGCPTTVNNVETIAQVPDIIRRGAAGSPASASPTIPVPSLLHLRPCRAPCSNRRPWASRELIERHAGAARRLGQPAAVIPGARQCRWPGRADQADTLLMDSTAAATKNPRLTAAVIVMDRSADIVKAMAHLFLKHESCGQCIPRRHGWMWRLLNHGGRPRAKARDRRPHGVTTQIEGHTICAFSDPRLPVRDSCGTSGRSRATDR